MATTLQRARERFGELPRALTRLEAVGRLDHYWPAIEALLAQSSPPAAVDISALLDTLAELEEHPEFGASSSPDAQPEFVMFFARELPTEPPNVPVSATCCVCSDIRAKDSSDWYPRALVEPLLPPKVLYSHGLCPTCARSYEFDLVG